MAQHKRMIERYVGERPHLRGKLEKIKNLKDLWNEKILVVDDDDMISDLLKIILEDEGLVTIARDGGEALGLLENGYYALIVSDVDMPRLNGIDLIRRIRAEPKFSALPIIVISYKDREQDRLRGLEAGANYYLTKSSFQDDTFIKAVTDLIGEAK